MTGKNQGGSSTGSEGPEAAESQVEQRRLPRLSVGHEQFRLTENGKVFSVQDLSPNGVSILLIDAGDTVLFPAGRRVAGTLNLWGAKFLVKVKVSHVTPAKVGFEIEEMDEKDRERFESQISPEVLGQSLRMMPHEHLESLWFHAPGGVDLLLYRSTDGGSGNERSTDGTATDFERPFGFFFLLHFDRYISGSPGDLETGRVTSTHEVPEGTTLVRLENVDLEADLEADSDQIAFARALIKASKLPEGPQAWLTQALNS